VRRNNDFIVEAFHSAVVSADRDLSALRRRLAAWLEEAGAGEPARSALILATHEGVANALAHSHSPEPVEVDAEAYGEIVTIEVRDHGHWQPCSRERLGLKLIRASVETAHIAISRTGTTLRLTQSVKAGARPRPRRSKAAH
jgi:anti-sigma regulatory factor (Ser/Thr protein kinase)